MLSMQRLTVNSVFNLRVYSEKSSVANYDRRFMYSGNSKNCLPTIDVFWFEAGFAEMYTADTDKK